MVAFVTSVLHSDQPIAIFGLENDLKKGEVENILVKLAHFRVSPEKKQKTHPTSARSRVGTPTQKPIPYTSWPGMKISDTTPRFLYSFSEEWKSQLVSVLEKEGPPFLPSSGLTHEHLITNLISLKKDI